MFVLSDISKTVGGETHIYPTNLRLAPGSFTTLLGTTLAGKTTLMQMMVGLEKPTTGDLFFNEEKVTNIPVQQRNVSMVYQQFINYPSMTTFENIASPLKVAGLKAAEISIKVGEMAELMRISHLLDRSPALLSGGQQQRTALARALIKDSSLILLDEPLANLDFKLREELRDELPRIFKQRQCVVVYATTEPVEALLFGGHTVALHQGKVVDFGETSRLYRNPSNLITAKVFSEPPINIAEAENNGTSIQLIGGGLKSLRWSAPVAIPKGKLTIGLRSHAITASKPTNKYNQSIRFEATVNIAEISGSESIIHFSLGNTANNLDWISLSQGIYQRIRGERITLYADTSQCLYFDQNGELIDCAQPHFRKDKDRQHAVVH